MIRATKIRQKEVINISTGARLGYVNDVEIDLQSGKLDAIIVPCRDGLFNFFSKEKEHIIPWSNIVKVGDDIILVTDS